jgi:hypothetical protein
MFRHDEGTIALADAFREAWFHYRISTNPTSPISDLGSGLVPANVAYIPVNGDREVPIGSPPPPPVLYPVNFAAHDVRGTGKTILGDYTVKYHFFLKQIEA